MSEKDVPEKVYVLCPYCRIDTAVEKPFTTYVVCRNCRQSFRIREEISYLTERDETDWYKKAMEHFSSLTITQLALSNEKKENAELKEKLNAETADRRWFEAAAKKLEAEQNQTKAAYEHWHKSATEYQNTIDVKNAQIAQLEQLKRHIDRENIRLARRISDLERWLATAQAEAREARDATISALEKAVELEKQLKNFEVKTDPAPAATEFCPCKCCPYVGVHILPEVCPCKCHR